MKIKEGQKINRVLQMSAISKDEYKALDEKQSIAGFEFDEIFLISNPNKDRHGDTIQPNGWDLTKYNQNVKGEVSGTVLLHHNSRELPVGKSFVWIEGNELYAGLKLADDVEGYDLGKIVAGLIRGNYLKNASVGFIPKQWEENEDGYNFKEQELIEWSLVNIPALPDAKRKELLAKGFDVDGAEKLGLIGEKSDCVLTSKNLAFENELLKEALETEKEINKSRKAPIKVYRKFLVEFRELMDLPEIDNELKAIEQVFGSLKTIASNNLWKTSQDGETHYELELGEDSKLKKYFN